MDAPQQDANCGQVNRAMLHRRVRQAVQLKLVGDAGASQIIVELSRDYPPELVTCELRLNNWWGQAPPLHA